jgi:ribosomal protein L40E
MIQQSAQSAQSAQAIQLADPPPSVDAGQGFVFRNYQKYGLLIFIAGLLYLRLARRKRGNDKVCPRCGRAGRPQASNCAGCGAPLLVAPGRGGSRCPPTPTAGTPEE